MNLFSRSRVILLVSIGVLLLVGFVALIVELRKKTVDRIPDDPDSLTLISIDGPETWKGPTTGESLYAGHVLGQVEITDPVHRREIVAAVKEAIRNPHPDRLGCWMPRHVLRLVKNGKMIDLVICFECHAYTIHVNHESQASAGGGIHPDGQAVLDKCLKDAGIPISPKIGH